MTTASSFIPGLGGVTPRAAPAGAARVACAHCGLDVPAGLVGASRDEQFCCHGCETAFAVIRSCGLDRYYALRDELDGAPRPARGSGRTCAEFDDGVFRRLYVRGEAGGVCACELFLQGVHCSACVWLVERLPRLAPGVIEARLDLRRSIVRVVWDDARVSLSRVARALDAIGYTPHAARDARARELRKSEDRRQLVRLAVAGACAGNVMLFATALYAGLFDAMDPAHAGFFRWISMGLTLVSLAWPGAVFFRSAWAAVRTRTAHLDLPIALALAAGAVWSVVSTLRGAGEVYFDTLSVLVFALLVGRFIQARQQRWASDAVELLFAVTPASARRVDADGEVREVAVEALRPGDVVEVRAGESFPGDGEVVEGASGVDASLLTGESRPVGVGPGDPVLAGSVNVSASVRARVSATGEATRVGRLMRLVEDAARRRAPIVRLADRASAWFVVGMLAAAGATLLAWSLLDPAHALEHAIALLVVTCPCALGIATPMTLTVALGRAARGGMLIKGADAVQRLADGRGPVFLDKTGTVTFGRLTLVEWFGDAGRRGAVAALEAHSSHPIARALARDLAGEPGDGAPVEDVRQTLGGGIEGRVGGAFVSVGSLAFLRARGDRLDAGLVERGERAAREGFTPVGVSVDGALVALGVLGDGVRPDARGAIEALRGGARGRRRVVMLSGDHPEVVRRVAAEVGLAPEDALGGLSPEDKLRIVREAGPGCVMVGDGVNDAAALAAAGVGIAVHGGAEASLAAADVYLSRPGLDAVVELRDGAVRAMRVVRRNLAVSVCYNVLAGGTAALGLMGPLLAAVVMPISSLTVVAISLRARTFGGRRAGGHVGGRVEGGRA